MIEYDPFVSPDIRCGANTLALDKFGKGLGRTFEAHLLRNGSQGQSGKNLAANLEAEIVPPLQVLGGVGKGQAILADFIHAHRGYLPGDAGFFGSGAVWPLHDFVILSGAVFQAQRRISRLTGLTRKPNCTTALPFHESNSS